MRFTKGLFIGTALGMSAAMMMNNKSRNNRSNGQDSNNGYSLQNNSDGGKYSTTSTGIIIPSDTQSEDYVVNDII